MERRCSKLSYKSSTFLYLPTFFKCSRNSYVPITVIALHFISCQIKCLEGPGKVTMIEQATLKEINEIVVHMDHFKKKINTLASNERTSER